LPNFVWGLTPDGKVLDGFPLRTKADTYAAPLLEDLDGDGDLDLLLTQCGGPAQLWRNERARAPSFTVRGLPVGSQLLVTREDGTRLLATAAGQGSYFGASSPHAHVGLDPAQVRTLELRVPYGQSVSWTGPLLPAPLRSQLLMTLKDGAWVLR